MSQPTHSRVMFLLFLLSGLLIGCSSGKGLSGRVVNGQSPGRASIGKVARRAASRLINGLCLPVVRVLADPGEGQGATSMMNMVDVKRMW